MSVVTEDGKTFYETGINGESRPDDPKETPMIENVGEEFMKWAEKHWALETLITAGLNSNAGGESCPYKCVRDCFVLKINELSIQQVIKSHPEV
jgi:hypothetical protein